MPFRGPAELVSMLMSRLHHLTVNKVSGENAKERLETVLEVGIKSNLLEMAGNNQIPNGLIREDIDRWSQRMSEVGVFGSSIEVNRTPQIVLNLRAMTEAIFKDYTPPRTPISPFVQPGVGFRGLRAARVIQDESLSLELEERGLKEVIVPGTINKEGRKRIGASVQQALADAETQRKQQLEEQKKLDAEETEIAKTGFG